MNRRDKNVRSWPMAAVRLPLYLLDAFSTRRMVHKALRSDLDFVIFDRYIYDELANLNLRNPLVRFYARVIMKIVPRPDVSYLLDAEPLQARARKPEYPLEFIYINRQSYHKLCSSIGGITVIPPCRCMMCSAKCFIMQSGHSQRAWSSAMPVEYPCNGPAEAHKLRSAAGFLRGVVREHLIEQVRGGSRSDLPWLFRKAAVMHVLRNARFRLLLSVATAVLLAPVAWAANCITQAQMTPADRNAIVDASRSMMLQVQNGNVNGLKAVTLPAVAADFAGIASSVQGLAPQVQQAFITVDSVYDLDASTDQPGAANTQFFCGSPVVIINFNNLPPGKYALALLHATGVKEPQQVSLILAQGPDKHWMLAGFFAKPMIQAGHDGLWYWVSARKYAEANGKWAAWFYYRLANDLLDPLDNLSSPNLEKLRTESNDVKPDNLPSDRPFTLNANGTAFQLSAVDTTTQFGGLDLDVHYLPDSTQAAQLRDPPSARKQVVDIMNELLVQHPELHTAFHGMWVHADQGNVSLFALELPMDQVTQPGASPVNR